MSTLDGLIGSPTRTAILSRNLSSPRLTRIPKPIQTNWDSPCNSSIAGMQSIKQEHFYIEKLRIQRERMQLLKVQFEKKDAAIETLNTQLYKMTLMYEESIGYRRKYQQLLTEYQHKASQFEELSQDLSKAHTKIDVFEVEVAKLKGDSDRQITQIEVLGVELQNQQQRRHQLEGYNEYSQRDLETMAKRHRAQIDNIKAKWSDLKSQLEDLRKQNTNIKEQHHRGRHEYEQQKQHIRRLETELSESKSKAAKLQQDIDKTVASFDEQRSSELSAYEQYSQDLSVKLAKAQERSAKMESVLKKNKTKYRQTESCIKEVHSRLDRQISRAEYLEEQMRNKDILIERYKVTQKQQMDLVERLKSELKEHQENFKKYQRGPQKALRSELERLRRELYLLRNAQVDKIERVFHSFGINENSRM